MKKIAFAGYRSWAIDVLNHMYRFADSRKDVSIIKQFLTKKDFDEWKPEDVDMIVFAGWSWIIPEEIINNYTCICIHPSNLPAFSGGSPIQNQVLSGIYDSVVTVFKMNNEIDAGPIYMKAAVSLLGPIEEVFEKIALAVRPIMRSLMTDLANEELSFYNQQERRSAIHKRRKPQDSQLTTEKVNKMNFNEFQNMVNCLRRPYPVVTVDGVECTSALKFKELPENKPYLEVADGFAVINQ